MTVIVLRHAKIKRIADDYYRLLANYGVEFASIWLDDKLKCPEDIRLFKTMQQDIANNNSLVMVI